MMRMLRFLGLAVLVVCIAAFASGCGGGGGTAQAPTTPEPTPMPTPQETCEADGGRYNADGSCTSAADLAEEMKLSAAQEAAMAAYMAAMAAAGGAKDPVAMGKAQMYADMAKSASDAAAMAMTSAMAMEYQMKAEMNRDMAMKAAGDRGLGITKLANMITNQAAIDNAILEGREAPKAVSNAGRVGAELAATAEETGAGAVLHDVIGEFGAAVNQGTLNPLSPEVWGALAVYGASGPAISLTDSGLRSGENPVLLTTRGGWTGRELVNSSSTFYFNAYTDVQPTKTVSSYADAPDTPVPLVVPTDGTTSGVTGDIPGDGSDFEGTYNANIADNVPPVSGLFDCTAANGVCSISVNEDGEIVAIQGYEFRAATGTTTMADGDYLAWGVWLEVPDAPASAASAGAVASGNDVFEVRAALTGTATYNGVASGLYAAGGMVEYFDADVSLTANFGGTVAADATPATATENSRTLLGAVTGSVSGIKAGGMDVEGMLTLKRAPVVAATVGTDSDPAETTTGFEATVSGTLAGRAMEGNWGGQFYGPNKASGKGIETEYPTTAAGTFGASAPGNANDPIRILGAFGAWKAE